MPFIFWLEDDLLSTGDLYSELKKEYDIIRCATSDLIEQGREKNFDLVILDLMIHTETYIKQTNGSGKGKTVRNITFENCNWRQTGIEFLKQIRKGDYSNYGFKKDVPVLIVSAVADYTARDEALRLGAMDYIDKPVSFNVLNNAIKKTLQIE